MDCGLSESSVKQQRFSLDSWAGLNLDTNDYEDEYFLDNERQRIREGMICDLTQNKLIKGKKNLNILKYLGPSLDDFGNTCRMISIDIGEERLYSKKFKKLIYEAGNNASGGCYLILYFDQAGKYIGAARAVAI
jgi:hypothetical protein